MRKLFLSAGHQSYNNIDSGAVANGISEADLTTKLRDLIVKQLKLNNVDVIVDTDQEDLKETMQHISNSLDEKDLAIEIHFNAGVKEAFGTESFIPDKYSTFEFNVARLLNKTTISVLQTYDRGVRVESQSQHKRLGFMRPNCENVLHEVCFITNSSDLFKLEHNIETLGVNLANTIISIL